MKTKLIFLILSFLRLPGLMYAQQDNVKLHELFDRYYKELNALNPLDATFNGVNDYNDQLPADDEAQLSKTHVFYTNYLKELHAFEKAALNSEDKISYAIMESDLQTTLKLEKYHAEYMPINQMYNIPMFLAIFGSGTSSQPFNTIKDYNNWLKRCKAFSTWTNVAITNMRKGIRIGMVLPKALVIKIIPQFLELAKNDSLSSFYLPIKNFPASFSENDKKNLSVAFKEVIPKNIFASMQKLATFLQTEYLRKSRLTSGINALPNGKEMYKDYILAYATVNIDPEELYKTGLSEVARITSEMEKIKASVNFTGSLAALFDFMKTDSRFMPFKTDKDVLDAYQHIYDKIKPQLSKYFGIQPKLSFEIRKVEDFRAASAPPQYFRGDVLSNRPGVFYIPILDPQKVNATNIEMESVFLHEAIPGHHFQISLQYENNTLPAFRQKYGNSAFVEGWGLYAESLGKELGVLTDPYHQIGALGAEMHRAIRLVVDAGLHTGKMTREEAIKYSLQHEPISEEVATLEIERYMALPAQALSYKVGELKIKELRDKYKKQLGNIFNLRDFHDAILKSGAMPLTVFENYMDEWATKSGQTTQ